MAYVASITCPPLPMKLAGYKLHYRQNEDGSWYVWATHKGVLQSESVMNTAEAWYSWCWLSAKGWR